VTPQAALTTLTTKLYFKSFRKKNSDGRFLELVRRFLKSGYFEFKQVFNSFSGSPQGGIISPILANIYLDKLDKFIEKIILENTLGNYFTTQ